ncbi:hypothetical protein FPQ18DRAFT_302121 [Pyronema domesticum]|nr:hypothetical protein FPQ18DRAFT_302121 [Pyronema domesticum]
MDMGTRKDRQLREAQRRDEPNQELHGEERPEDGLHEEEWERDLFEEWLFERDEERGEEKDGMGGEEVLDIMAEEEAGKFRISVYISFLYTVFGFRSAFLMIHLDTQRFYEDLIFVCLFLYSLYYCTKEGLPRGGTESTTRGSFKLELGPGGKAP